MSMIDSRIEEFLRRPLVAVLATIDAEGRPRTVPLWFRWEDNAAYMFTGRDTLKWRNLLRNPYASLCVDSRELPYASVIMDGPVEEAERPHYDIVLPMALGYYGETRGRAFAEGYRENSRDTVIFRLTPRRIKYFRED